MGPILNADCITRPKVWPRETLEQARALKRQRLAHPNTQAAGRAEAEALIALIDAELAARKKAGRTY